MKGCVRKQYIALGLIVIVFLCMNHVVAADEVILDYYYSTGCGSCKPKTKIMNQIEANYSGLIIVHYKPIETRESPNWTEWENHGFTTFPALVINNETKIKKANITREYVEAVLDSYLRERDFFEMLQFYLAKYWIPLVLGVLLIILGSVAVRTWRKEKKKE